MTIDNMKAYKKNNIKLIKQYLKKLLKMDYEALDIFTLITLEHRLFYDIYEPYNEIIKGDKK